MRGGRLVCRSLRLAPAVAPAAALLLAAAPAYCDPFGDLIGPLVTRLAAGLIAEVCIIPIEAVAYWHFLRISGYLAFGTSLAANVASFAAGWAVAFALSASSGLGWEDRPGSVFARAAVGFAVLLVVELPIVLGLNRSHRDRRRVLNVAVGVNLCTYIAARIFILALFPRLVGEVR